MLAKDGILRRQQAILKEAKSAYIFFVAFGKTPDGRGFYDKGLIEVTRWSPTIVSDME